MPAKALDLLPLSQRRFGRYTLLCHLASGGMADLYLARVTGTDGFEKLVAIKRIHASLSEEAEFIQMFVDEARIASRVAHPNVVQVLELGTVDASYYITMEFVDGETLTALLRRQQPPLRVCARIISSAAAGLHAAHELRSTRGELLNVVHRDVSPHNILLSYSGEVKVTDFGVARARDNLHRTVAGTLKGKFAYMSPEQAKNDPVDRRSDIFSLGIVLYEITTMHRLFRAENELATLEKVARGNIPRPSLFTPSYPRRLEDVVMTALDRDPARRFQTAEEMQSALESYIMESQRPLLPSALGQLMRQTFADRIEQKRELLLKCEQGGDIPSAAGEPDSGSLTMGGATVSSPHRSRATASPQRRRGSLWLAGIALLVLAAAGGATALWLERAPDANPPAAAAPPPKPAAPADVAILIQAKPLSAQIAINGAPVQNPYKARHPARDSVLKARITADGYLPQELDIPLNEGGRWVIALERAAPPPPADAAPDEVGGVDERDTADRRRPRHRRHPRRHRPSTKRPAPREQGRESELFGNPFEE